VASIDAGATPSISGSMSTLGGQPTVGVSIIDAYDGLISYSGWLQELDASSVRRGYWVQQVDVMPSA
jgi:hypothetical protein